MYGSFLSQRKSMGYVFILMLIVEYGLHGHSYPNGTVWITWSLSHSCVVLLYTGEGVCHTNYWLILIRTQRRMMIRFK